MTLRDTLHSPLLVALHSRLGWATWLYLLVAFTFSGISEMARMNADVIVAWLLSQGTVGEAWASSLLFIVTNGATAAGIWGLVTAALIVVWVVLGIYPWSPVLAAAEYLGKALRPVIGPILHDSHVLLVWTSAVAASLVRYLGNRTSTILVVIRVAAASTGCLSVRLLALSVVCVQTVVFRPMRRAGVVLLSAIGQGWALASSPLARLGRTAVSGAQQFRQVASVIVRSIRLASVSVCNSSGVLLNHMVTVVNTAAGALELILQFGRHVVRSVAGRTKQTLKMVVIPVSRAFILAFRSTSAFVWQPFSCGWWNMVLIEGSAGRTLSTTAGRLGGALAR